MEAIKCPNCGSEKVQELTEEKYVCLACDNVFLIHNLSKEFRQTDAHISELHQDLKKEIRVLKDGKETEYNVLLAEGEEALLDDDEIKAYEAFRRYSILNPESSKGYIGMFRAVTNDFDGAYTASIIKNYDELGALYDGFDVLNKALECEDCNQEELLCQSLSYYKDAANTAFIQVAVSHAECDEEFGMEFDVARECYEFLINTCKEILDELLEKQKEYNEANIITRKIKGLEKPDEDVIAISKEDIEWYQETLNDDILKVENMTMEELREIISAVAESEEFDTVETIHQGNRARRARLEAEGDKTRIE